MRPSIADGSKSGRNEIDLRCRVVVRGCFQNVEKNEEDNLFALDTFTGDNEIAVAHGNVSKLGNNPGRCEHCLPACSNVWRSVRLATKRVLPEWRLSLEIEEGYVRIETGPKTVARALG